MNKELKVDIMLDIETLAKHAGAPVISIGAVSFDLLKTYDEIYLNLDLESQIDSGRRQVDASTIKWWMQQKLAAKKVFSENSKDVKTSLTALSAFIKQYKNPYVWAKGPHFDIAILESLYREYGMEVPWKYSKIMDQRTLERFLGKDLKVTQDGVSHNALDDAKYQAKRVQTALRRFHGVS